MRLLIDTHILLAHLAEDEGALPPHLHRIRAGRDALLYVSVASLWEIALKTRVGKLTLGVPLNTLPDLIGRMGMDLVIIDQHHVLKVLDPLPPTRDPFDRLLLAQCAVEGPRLITLDRSLLDHPLAWRPA